MTEISLETKIERLTWTAQVGLHDEIDIIKEDTADTIGDLKVEMNDTIRELKRDSAAELRANIGKLKAAHGV